MRPACVCREAEWDTQECVCSSPIGGVMLGVARVVACG